MIVYINREIVYLVDVMDVDELHRGDFALKVKNSIKSLLYLCGITIDLVHSERMDLIKRNSE